MNLVQSTEKSTNVHLKDLLKYLQSVVMTPNETEKIGGNSQLLISWARCERKNAMMMCNKSHIK